MSTNMRFLMICIVLTIAILIAFWQVTQCDFTNYDDPAYITENDHIQNGLTMAGIRWAFTTDYAENWHPLTWLSHMLDVQLFGLRPRWHHLTNLLFHLANTLLLFFVLHRMTNALWKSAFVAALFALHPLHVESVAWVAERKDVLSAFFWMLTLGAYGYYVERPKVQRYLLVVVFFVLGLMSKPMLVTLPFVLLLLDYWPLRRLEQTTSVEQKGKSGKKRPAGHDMKADKPADYQPQWAVIRPLLWEKIPLIALAALSSIVTFLVQQKGGAVASFEAIPVGVRIANAVVSYVAYIGQMIWPHDLAVLYPHPVLLPPWQVFGSAILLIAVTITAIWHARRNPHMAVGWLWYAGTLVPVIGIVQVGLQARADRYTYLPQIGLFIMAAWGVSDLSKNWRHRKEVLFAASSVILLCLCIVTRTQVRYWQNSITLFGHALQVTENNYTAYYNRGTALAKRGDYQQAIGDYDKVIEINPTYKEAYNNRGNAYASLGNYRQAIENYDKALEINPKHITAYNNRGNAYLLLGNNWQSIGNYDKALEIDPNYAEAYYNRGHAYANLGNDKQALEDWKTAARLGYISAQNRLKSQGIGW